MIVPGYITISLFDNILVVNKQRNGIKSNEIIEVLPFRFITKSTSVFLNVLKKSVIENIQKIPTIDVF